MAFFTFLNTLKETFFAWLEVKGPRLGAALAFYTALSLGPLLVIVLAIGSLLFAKDLLSSHLIQEMGNLIGKDGAEVFTIIIARSQQPQQGFIASVLGLIVLLIGASGVFGELQDALNTIWNVPAKTGQPYLSIIRSRFISFTMVLGTGFMLLISLVITATLNGVAMFINSAAPGLSYFMGEINWIISLIITTGLFALIFKEIPDVETRWRDVWKGAVLTAFLFDLGKMLIGIYLGHSAIGTTYGAAGSFVVFLVWIYYSAQILYFGATFTKVQNQKRVNYQNPL